MTYPVADIARQWFARTHPGTTYPRVEKVVWHTTEGISWPAYSGGAVAPHYTVLPDYSSKTMRWRAHFPDLMNARALINKPGGVQTNLDGALQVEIVGTCDPTRLQHWRGDFLKSWALEPWQVEGLAKFAAYAYTEHGVPLTAPRTWLAYGPDPRAPGRVPASYGASPARFTSKIWDEFRGHCGHQHVAENHHGDPGAFQIDRVLTLAKLAAKPDIKQEVAAVAAQIVDLKHTTVTMSAKLADYYDGAKEGDELSLQDILLYGGPRLRGLSTQMAEFKATLQRVETALAGLNQAVAALAAAVGHGKP